MMWWKPNCSVTLPVLTPTVLAEKGFFERANGGTVLLDEIAEMSPQMQNQAAALPE